MRPNETYNMLNFNYVKSSEEIKEKAREKISLLQSKIAERELRLAKTRAEYEIDDAMMLVLLTQARKDAKAREEGFRNSYSVSKTGASQEGRGSDEVVTIGAGVVNMLFTESDFIEAEKGEIKKLTLIVRNLKDLEDSNGKVRGHTLQQHELEYLGF